MSIPPINGSICSPDPVGVAPFTTCRKSGRYVTDPKSDTPTIPPIAAAMTVRAERRMARELMAESGLGEEDARGARADDDTPFRPREADDPAGSGLFVLKGAATDVYRRLMDAVDPELRHRYDEWDLGDLWDVERLSTCQCSPARVARLRVMNDTQRIPSPVLCDCAARR